MQRSGISVDDPGVTTHPTRSNSRSAQTCSQIRHRRLGPDAMWLAIEGGPRLPLPDGRPLTIGSGRAADIVLDDPFVSARHCTVHRLDDDVVIEDLRSKNGTFVDGIRVDRVRVAAGVRVRLGEHVIRIDAGSASLACEAPPAGPTMIGSGPAFSRLRRALLRLAPLRQPVLVRGETGTGKELAARALHRAGPRRDGPFVELNCATIVDGLAESTLFGHVRGAFTGAHRDHVGAFVRATGGTLFLDEVAELPLAVQAKLLRVLETGRVTPVGSEREIVVDARVVAATHRPLEEMSARKQFREDLYHRLSVLVLEVPPLRERPDDIPALLAHFARVTSLELGRTITLSPEAIAAAQRHPWPGNIRALRNAVLRAGAMCDSVVTPAILISGEAEASDDAEAPAAAVRIPRGDYSTMNRELLRRSVYEHGSIRRAAVALGIPRSTLGAWLRRLGIPPPTRARRASSRARAAVPEARTVNRPRPRTAREDPR